MSEQKQYQKAEIKPVNFEELVRRVVREELERFFADRSSPWPRHVAQTKDTQEW